MRGKREPGKWRRVLGETDTDITVAPLVGARVQEHLPSTKEHRGGSLKLPTSAIQDDIPQVSFELDLEG